MHVRVVGDEFLSSWEALGRSSIGLLVIPELAVVPERAFQGLKHFLGRGGAVLASSRDFSMSAENATYVPPFEGRPLHDDEYFRWDGGSSRRQTVYRRDRTLRRGDGRRFPARLSFASSLEAFSSRNLMDNGERAPAARAALRARLSGTVSGPSMLQGSPRDRSPGQSAYDRGPFFPGLGNRRTTGRGRVQRHRVSPRSAERLERAVSLRGRGVLCAQGHDRLP